MENKVITPTVGRKVWFFPATEDVRDLHGATPGGQVWKYGEQPMDATIVYVHDQRKVNLAVQDHAGLQHVYPSVQLVQEGDAYDPLVRYCTWMPYQVGQAKKEAGCVYEARNRQGDRSMGAPVEMWCRVHGFDCPNAVALDDGAPRPRRVMEQADKANRMIKACRDKGPLAPTCAPLTRARRRTAAAKGKP